MGLAIFTLIHILISLGGIISGLVVLGGWVDGFFSGDHGGDKCHRVLFPVSRFHTGLQPPVGKRRGGAVKQGRTMPYPDSH